MKIIKKYLKNHIFWLLAGMGCSFLMTMSLVCGTGIIAELIDQLLKFGDISIQYGAMIIVPAIIIGSIAAYFKDKCIGKYSIDVIRELNERSMAHLIGIKVEYIEKEGNGKIITKMLSDINEIEKFVGSTMPDLVAAILAVMMTAVYVASKSILLMFVSMIFYPMILVIVSCLGNILKRLASNRRGRIDTMVEQVMDSVDGIQIVRSYNLYGEIVNKINHTIDHILDNEYKRAWIMHFSQTVQRFLFCIPNMLCPVIALILVIEGKITVGTMTAYIVLMNKMIEKMKSIPFLINDYKEKVVSINRLEEILEAPSEENFPYGQEKKASSHKKSSSEKELDQNLICGGSIHTNTIEWIGVCFAYKDGKKQVLSDVSFAIQKGKEYAIVGPSGQGKTTIFKLLCGFYDLSQGDYFCNGINANEALKDLRSKIAIVPQNSFIFNGTVAENILIGKDAATMEEIVEAAKMAGIHARIMEFKDQYQTKLGEEGTTLSGGECQRICIARALLKDASILLLDEPTASVDEKTEQAIFETLQKLRGKKTIIIITHKLSTIANADQIFLINDGKLKEQGTHEELMERNHTYSNLYHYEEGLI